MNSACGCGRGRSCRGRRWQAARSRRAGRCASLSGRQVRQRGPVGDAQELQDPEYQVVINFALFDLVGKVLSPRVRDLGKITIIRDDTPAAIATLYPHAGPLLSARWNENLVEIGR